MTATQPSQSLGTGDSELQLDQQLFPVSDAGQTQTSQPRTTISGSGGNGTRYQITSDTVSLLQAVTVFCLGFFISRSKLPKAVERTFSTCQGQKPPLLAAFACLNSTIACEKHSEKVVWA